jgi:hypothetical protein
MLATVASIARLRKTEEEARHTFPEQKSGCEHVTTRERGVGQRRQQSKNDIRAMREEN